MIATQTAVIEAVVVESAVGGNPDAVAAFQQVGDVHSSELPHDGSQFAAFQPSACFAESVESFVDVGPYRSVAVDVADADIGCDAQATQTAHVCYAAVGGKSISVDAVARHVPQGTLRVAVHPDRLLCQQSAHIALPVGRHGAAHGVQVGHHHTLVVGRPQPLVAVFGKALARVADAAVGRFRTQAHERISVVAYGTASVAGHPDEALAIDKDMVDVIVWQSSCQVETRHVVPLGKRILCTGGYCQQVQEYGYKDVTHGDYSSQCSTEPLRRAGSGPAKSME